MNTPTQPQPTTPTRPRDPEPIRESGPWQPRHHGAVPAIDLPAHTLAHPAPVHGCPWCLPVPCPVCPPCAVCPDPTGHRRQHAGSEYTLLAGARC